MDSPDLPVKPEDAKSGAFVRAGLGKRTISTIGLWVLVIAMFLWGHPAGFVAMVGLLTILGTLEFHVIAGHAGVLPMPRLGMVAALLYTGVLYWLLLSGHGSWSHELDTLAFASFLGAGFMLRLMGPVDGMRSVIGLSVALLGFVYLAFGMGFVGRIIFHDYPGQGDPAGAWLALWLVAVTKFTDMGAFLMGTAIGKHKMIPHISPGKTWEGLIGAILLSQGVGCGMYAAFPTQLAVLGGWPHVIALGLLLAIGAVIGDLAESFVKRSLAIKDSGHSLPGIGGVLDLIDSLCFTAPILYFYIRHFSVSVP